MIRVLSPGLFTTLQDLGRSGYCHLGVSAAGAADPLALRVANRLVGNDEAAAAFEMTLHGGRFAFESDSVISLCGGEFEASVGMWRAVEVRRGEVVEVGVCRLGARGYLAVRGGLAGDSYLGSLSTHVLSGFGRAVQKGDVFAISNRSNRPPCGRSVAVVRDFGRVRVTRGAGTGEFGGAAVFGLLDESWRVSEQSNRQGVRLQGRRIENPGSGAMVSEGAALGAIQVPPGGEPVILFVDSQTTGGYPVVANVASVDVGVVGQLRPRAMVCFEAVSFDAARSLLVEQEEWIRGCCV